MVDAAQILLEKCCEEQQALWDFQTVINLLVNKIGNFNYSLFTIEKEIETCDMMGNKTGLTKIIKEQRVLYKDKDYSIYEFKDIVNGYTSTS